MNEIKSLINRIPELESCKIEIENACEVLLECFRNGNKLLLCGNGGSAADCEHISGELIKRFSKPRHLTQEIKDKLGPELSENLHGALPAISLPSMIGFGSAFCNDDVPEYAFAQQILAFGKKGDVLLAISTSGNSKNVIHAIDTANRLGLETIGLTGLKGGKLSDSSEICIKVPEEDVPRVQELHLPVYHTICQVLEDILFP